MPPATSPFVGGSLVPVGGHNLLEPAAQGLPIITGPNVFNAQDVADKFVDLGACLMVSRQLPNSLPPCRG